GILRPLILGESLISQAAPQLLVHLTHGGSALLCDSFLVGALSSEVGNLVIEIARGAEDLAEFIFARREVDQLLTQTRCACRSPNFIVFQLLRTQDFGEVLPMGIRELAIFFQIFGWPLVVILRFKVVG